MKRNIIYELAELHEELIDKGYYLNSSGETIMYTDDCKSVFLRLVDFVRKGSFVTSATQKFVCQNYLVRQADLESLWDLKHNDGSTRKATTFRLSSQKVNEVLSKLLPDDYYNAFMENRVERIKELDTYIKVLESSCEHIDERFGATLNERLMSLPSTYKHYTVEECTRELSVLYRMSEFALEEELSACDTDKLAYIYDIIRRPAFSGGKVNQLRLDFIEGYFGMGGVKSADRETSTIKEEHSPVKEHTETKTVLSGSVVRVMKEYIGGESADDDTMLNPDIIALLASVSVERFKSALNSFLKSEVDYVLKLFLDGDEDILSAYRKYIETGDMDSVGEYYFLSGVVPKLRELTDGVEPSGKSSPYITQVLADYLLNNFRERAEALSAEDLKQALIELETDDSETSALLDKFSGADVMKYEQERLAMKRGSLG